jgi:pyrroline-5-carboxylate reductase
LPTKLGVIGGGVMAEALISRLLAHNTYTADDIAVGEPTAARRQFLLDTYGVTVCDRNGDALATAETVLVAVKPQVFTHITGDLAAITAARPLILSIMAGVPLQTLEAAAPQCPVVRAMPNTPATVGAGMTAIAAGQHVTPDHLAQADAIFAAVGEVVTVPEHLMDAVTGLSGSGPGYLAVIIEALIDGGVSVGLPRATAQTLAIQTVLGTATLLQTTDLHPAVLKDRVTSPGGTTITGIAELEAAGVRSALIEAVKAACQRSQDLGSA